jgi:hypothetical protein
MSFSDYLAASRSAKAPAQDLKGAAVKAGIGLLGLALLPLLSGSSSFTGTAARMTAGLCAASALAFFVLRFLAQRTASAASSTPLRVVARTALSAKSTAAILEADGQRFVIVHGDGFAQLLSSTKIQHPDTTGEIQ